MTTHSLPTLPVAGASSALFRYSVATARYLLGLPLLVFGLNGFFNFIPQPEVALPENALAFLSGLVASGYMMPLIALTHLTVGSLLVVNRFVPLALVIFAPFIVNSVAFHVALERTGLPTAGVFLALHLFLAWAYRGAYQPLFVARWKP